MKVSARRNGLPFFRFCASAHSPRQSSHPDESGTASVSERRRLCHAPVSFYSIHPDVCVGVPRARLNRLLSPKSPLEGCPMKNLWRCVVLFAFLSTLLSHAQTNPTFQHVIIVIQENRTPDNLFGAYATQGYSQYLPALGAGYDISLASDATPWCLGTCFSPGHSHTDWLGQYDGGSYYAHGNSMNLENCTNGSNTCNGQTICGAGQQCSMPLPSWPQDVYTSPSDDMGSFNNMSPLYPYFDIAQKYGFANFFFQTNQGPSQPAHDFLFGGSSSPTGALDQMSYYYQLFSAENVNQNTSGCGTSIKASLIFPNGQTTDSNFNNDHALNAAPCFERQTMADLLDNANPQLTWRYYTNAPAGGNIMSIWTAPRWNSTPLLSSQ